MYISSIKIFNFKSIGELELDFQKEMNIIIGKNNVGKSNVLKALNLFFNKTEFEDNDYPISLSHFLWHGQTKDSYIEVTMYKSSTTSNSFDKRPIIIKSVFNDYRRDYLSRGDKEFEYITRDSFRSKIPSFIYLGDLSDKNISVHSLNEMFKINDLKTAQKVETYANQLIKNIWDQQIAISISFSQDEYSISIIDEYGNSNSFEYKSSGVQQLAYLVLFFAFSIVQGRSNYILALEEPETNLHVGIQKKLFKYLKSFSNNVQLFLTTHSSIFLDHANHEAVYHAVRNEDKETIVIKGGMKDNWLSLRSDLGLSISDSLFLGKYNILVEGITEKIILPTVIEIFHKQNKSFSLDDINIISAEGANNLHYFAKLITQTGLPTCILVDNDQEGLNAQKKLNNDSYIQSKSKVILLKRDHFSTNEFEDLIPDDLVISCLNNMYMTEFSVEDLKNSRFEKNTDSFHKFTKSFEKLMENSEDDKEKNDLSKSQLAWEIKKSINDKTDLSLLKPYIKEINNFFKQF